MVKTETDGKMETSDDSSQAGEEMAVSVPSDMPAVVEPDEKQAKMTLAKLTGWKPEEIELVRRTVAKDADTNELAFFLKIAKGVQLNPLLKEIWCYKVNRKKDGKVVGQDMLIFAGRDGFLAVAQRDPKYGGMRSSEVRENDDFEIDVPNGKVTHKFKATGLQDRGKIVGAYAIVFRKEGEPTVEWAPMERYNKSYNTWGSHPEEMIKKVAEVHALRRAFGIHGLYVEEEMIFKREKDESLSVESADIIEADTTQPAIDGPDFVAQVIDRLIKLSPAGAETPDAELLALLKERTGVEVAALDQIPANEAAGILDKLLISNGN